MSLATPLAAVTTGWHDAQCEVVGVVVGRVLGHAGQRQVRERQQQLGWLLVTEGDGEMADLTDPLGEQVARIGPVGIPVRERSENHHCVAAVGHDEVETVESEVRGYQSDG